MDIYTPENMIRFLYKETSAEETAAIQLVWDGIGALRKNFEFIKKSIGDRDTPHPPPRLSAIQSLLRYAGISKEVEQH